MKKSRWLLLLLILVTAVVINSCKKTGQSPIQSLFTGGSWQLASVEITNFIGSTVVSDTTYNDICNQFFTFYSDNTCTYTNFDCITQAPPAAPWTLTGNQLILQANVVCKDTTSVTKSSMPFQYALIQNLGQFSLVLRTGDVQPNYSLTKPRQIVEYGFIRTK